ncbi:hypothetical protein DIPPA_23700 [Diplonema papillatum]|nr:hypothetical protein DIPPA_23700 [Diplonema papillatum]
MPQTECRVLNSLCTMGQTDRSLSEEEAMMAKQFCMNRVRTVYRQISQAPPESPENSSYDSSPMSSSISTVDNSVNLKLLLRDPQWKL